ncbi:toprim domain-containing protein [Rufibacter quisquiliarum]|uniref:DNA primase n=1 Tax=Rufibacter quisquiliarum TaxID=1549639 RepID=A0A839GTI8_9BACT|nr:toprim domain-containing protein [Rufibacter quisquiliarum]MBA9077101.1 DNA primase [Rufibacter quisquiliarum]
MEITDIKAQLTLAQVLNHYGLKPDKHQRLRCPFHEDRTPSLQLYYKTHTAYCFSSNCKTHGKSLDVIDFILHKEGCTKHEAIEKAKAMLQGNSSGDAPQTKAAVLLKMFTYFRNAVHNSKPAQEYIKGRNLDYGRLEIGYNSGQFHHGSRRDEALIKSCLEVGLLQDRGLTAKTGEKAYGVFGKYCLVFALRSRADKITGLYFRSTVNESDQRHYYLANREGLYPGYPKPGTKKLILTEAIIDAASLLQQETVITEQFAVLSGYGTNGLTTEHQAAIKDLPELEELVFYFDGDQAGQEAVSKYAVLLHRDLPQVKISVVQTPEKEDVNSLLQGHEPEILMQLINERTPFLFSVEKSVEKEKAAGRLSPVFPETGQKQQPEYVLNTGNPNNIMFTGLAATYAVKGGVKPQLDSLKIALQIISGHRDYRCKLDLYEYKQLQQVAETATEILGSRRDLVEQDLMQLTNLLEAYREQYLQQGQSPTAKQSIKVPEASAKECIRFLQQPDLLSRFNQLIGKAGVTGEEVNRIFLFVIATSYKMPQTLHGLIQGSSGSGKTRLLKIISSLMPPEDVKRFTRVTESSFYNYGEYDLQNKLLCFEDVDGLKEEAQLALRELQSNDILISSTSVKSEEGHIRSAERTVRGPVATLSCTTRGEYYEDNISRCFLIAVDESREQTQRVISYQNNRAAGEINEKQERETENFIQNCVRLLQPCPVINPYANKIKLPPEAHKIRRLNEMYQSIVRQVTILNQYQRQKDGQGRLITQKEDMQTACEILFESILLKVDELDGSLRQFYEQLKSFVQPKGKDYEFNRFEVRAATGVSKTQQHYYIGRLVGLEYIKQFGFANRGFKYKIAHWDNMAALRTRIKEDLKGQLQNL